MTGRASSSASSLLEKAHWDKGRLIADLKAEWDIDVPEEDKDDRKDNGDSLVFEAGDMIAAVSLMHGPVPGERRRIMPKTTTCGPMPSKPHKAMPPTSW